MLPWQHGTHPAPLATASVDSWLLRCVCRNEALPDTCGVLRMMAKTDYHKSLTDACIPASVHCTGKHQIQDVDNTKL